MLLHASIAGQPENGVYAQTLISGNFLVVFNLSGPADKVDLELGRNVVSKIEEVIAQTPEIAPAELIEIIKHDVGAEISLSLLAAFISGQKLLLATVGKTGVKIVRKGAVITLSGSGVSGNLLQDDLAILGTEALLLKINFPEIVLQKEKNPEEIKEFLMAQVEEKGDGPEVAGLIVKLDLEKVEDVAEPEPVAAPIQPPGWGGLARFVPNKKHILYLKTVREKGFESAPPKKVLYLVGVAFVILVSVVAFQLRSRSLEVQNQSIVAVEKAANEGIASSGKLIGLNDQMARESLVSKKAEIVSEIEKNFGADWKNLKSNEGKRLLAIVAKIDAEIARAAHITNVPKPATFYDFSFLKAKPGISSAALHEGLMVALDFENGSIYSLGTDNKSGQIVGGGDFKENSFVDFAGDSLFVYSPFGIRKKDMSTNSSLKLATKNASSSGEIAAMASFGGNLYLLDPSNNQIWKYLGTEEGGFASPVPYVQPGLNLDLSGALGMTIDGFIYVFDKDIIWKFASGAPEELKLKSLAAPLGSINSVFASEEAKNIYIWDGTDNRIIVVNKEGVYQAQYQISGTRGQGLGTSTIILADEKLKKIFLVSGEKVYGIDIK